jgi:PAS domain S-box-containing protein
MVSAITYAVGYILILLTAASSAFAVWRRRETHRLDILALVALLLFRPFHEALGPVGRLLVLATPYVLLRLVHHFREVPYLLRAGALVAIPVGTIFHVGWARGESPDHFSLTWAYFVGLIMYAAAAFTLEARRSSGVTAKRLALAAVGTFLLGLHFVVAIVAPWVGEWARTLTAAGPFINTPMLACYYLAFATPQWLMAGWQRTEQARYLSLAADLDPEERGLRTAEDLSRAAASASGNAATLVALRPSLLDNEMVVRAGAPPSLVGLSVHPNAKILGRVLDSGTPIAGRCDECEASLAERLRRFGSRVLVAPIMTTSHTWGIVLVVQRRGTLFPEDDLRLLAQLGRYAGTALDHAQLVIEARERERKAADRRLREAQSRMALMLDNIRDYAMFVLDHRGQIVTWHIGAEYVFGYTAAEMEDEPAGPLYSMNEADFLRLLAEARSLGRAEFEGQCRRRDGGKFIGTTIITPLSGDDDELQGFVGVTRDVTEHRDLEQRLRQSQKMDAIGRLAGGIAHDFNNLLTAILGYADWLIQDFAHDPIHLQQLQEIQKAADRAANLTRQLLAFSRQQVLQPSPLNLSRLATDLLPMLRRLIGEHITIVDETDSEISAVMGDRSQLEQVVVNLAVNARDAMPTGGTLRIRTGRTWLDQGAVEGDLLPGPYALLEVSDTGIGMDAATQAQIFEPFFTTKEFGSGTGLGLATVYGIVKQMGGAVRVRSVPGEGTTFTLHFPETRTRESAAFVPSTTVEAPRGTETVLLVEDEGAVRSFLTHVLERQGYRVLAAEHQTAALALVKAHRSPIDLVITDVVMPGGTGPELVRALTQLRPGVPALYISGYADAVLSAQGAFAKASHFLQKPFSAPELLTRIRQILSRP